MSNGDGDGTALNLTGHVTRNEFKEYQKTQETLCFAYRESMKAEIKHGTDSIKMALAISTAVISIVVTLVNWYIQVAMK